jgi:hypothetical protein
MLHYFLYVLPSKRERIERKRGGGEKGRIEREERE